MKKSIIIPIIILVAAGAILIYVIPRNKSSNNSAGTSGNNTQNLPSSSLNQPGMFGSGSNMQSDSGQGGIVIKSLDMPQAGFAVIQQDNNGQPGNVLGSSQLLQTGTNSMVQVPTSVPLTPGMSYFVSIYDNSANQSTFVQDADKIISDQKGVALTQQFTAPQQPQPSSAMPPTGQ
ncbi:MAG: hypothetical protein M1383_02245 [Patescibacteria group bacterium]|nr:hypothetical protein [Patescibacteria group bacterium]